MMSINGIDVLDIFFSVSFYESVQMPIRCGELTLVEAASQNFLDDNSIEGIEPIEFEIQGANEHTYYFTGRLNKIKSRVRSASKSTITFEFASEAFALNEAIRVTKAYRNTNIADIVNEQNEKLKLTNWRIIGDSFPLTYIPPMLRPIDLVQKLQARAVAFDSNAEGYDGRDQTSESSGRGGLFWFERQEGSVLCTTNQLMNGEAGNDSNKLALRTAMQGASLEDQCNTILQFDVLKHNDLQSTMRFGAVKSKLIHFDMDKGLYHESTYDSSDQYSKEMQELSVTPTRVMSRMYSNENQNPSCEKATPFQFDQGPLAIQQSNARQISATSQVLHLQLNGRLDISPGDKLDIKIPTPSVANTPHSPDPKYSGTYIVFNVGHSVSIQGNALFTKLTVVRSALQTNDATSVKPD